MSKFRMWQAAIASLRGFGAAREGMAALEFAIMVPVMMTLYFGAT
jgi:Flp pilus assembly protein TadG